MGDVRPLPKLGGVFSDSARPARALRVSWHHDVDLVVLSLWDGQRCTGTIRMDPDDVPDLITALAMGLRRPGSAPPTDAPPADTGPDGPTEIVEPVPPGPGSPSAQSA